MGKMSVGRTWVSVTDPVERSHGLRLVSWTASQLSAIPPWPEMRNERQKLLYLV